MGYFPLGSIVTKLCTQIDDTDLIACVKFGDNRILYFSCMKYLFPNITVATEIQQFALPYSSRDRHAALFTFHLLAHAHFTQLIRSYDVRCRSDLHRHDSRRSIRDKLLVSSSYPYERINDGRADIMRTKSAPVPVYTRVPVRRVIFYYSSAAAFMPEGGIRRALRSCCN